MVSTSTVMVICEGVFDFVLFACAATFFAFAVSVAYFDQVPTAENPKRTKLLLNATEYVSERDSEHTHILICAGTISLSYSLRSNTRKNHAHCLTLAL